MQVVALRHGQKSVFQEHEVSASEECGKTGNEIKQGRQQKATPGSSIFPSSSTVSGDR